jgi:hypothetical protein
MHLFSAEVQARAARQAGRIAWWQLIAAGASPDQARVWVCNSRLIRCLPRVYALGTPVPSYEASLWEAVLYAGPNAMLSHRTAAHRRGYIKFPPKQVHVTTPRKVRSLPGRVAVHGQRPLERQLLGGLPITSPEQTILDVASEGNEDLVRIALAQMDFRQELNFTALLAISGRGKPGSTLLRTALEHHEPRLAQTNGKLEEDFFLMLERWGFQPLPQLNYPLRPDLHIDAAWPAYRISVETDGNRAHRSPARKHDDHRREMECRRLGWSTPIRYDWSQIHNDPSAVCDDLMTQLRLAAHRYGAPLPTIANPPKR